MFINVSLIDSLLSSIPEPLKLSLMGFLTSSYLLTSEKFISSPNSLNYSHYISATYLFLIIPIFLFLANISISIVAVNFFTKIKKLRDNLFLHNLLDKESISKQELMEVLKKFINVNWSNLNVRQKYIEFLLSDLKVEEAIVESKLTLKGVDPYNFNLTLLLANSYFSVGLYDECIDLCNHYLAFSAYSFEFLELRKQCQNVIDSQ